MLDAFVVSIVKTEVERFNLRRDSRISLGSMSSFGGRAWC